jgi:hypothetical protein
VVFPAVFLLGSLERRKKGPGGEWWWPEVGKGEGLGFDGTTVVVFMGGNCTIHTKPCRQCSNSYKMFLFVVPQYKMLFKV